MKKLSKKAGLGALVCTVALAGLVAGCAPQASEPLAATGSETNDTAVKGEYTPFDPNVSAENTSGKAIEGSEEEQLQQERIAGGAVGAVQSQNLEPLEGVTDYSEGDYVPMYGIDGDAAEVVHGSANGDACTTCHSEDASGTGTAMPQSHIGQNLADGDCVTCHEI